MPRVMAHRKCDALKQQRAEVMCANERTCKRATCAKDSLYEKLWAKWECGVDDDDHHVMTL